MSKIGNNREGKGGMDTIKNIRREEAEGKIKDKKGRRKTDR